MPEGRKVRHSGLIVKMQVEQKQSLPECGKLPSLADELLLCIIDQIDSHESLCNLAATCSRFQGLTEPYIWRSLLVLTGARARLIASALDRQETRTSLIQKLSIRYQDPHKYGIEELAHSLQYMDKLLHLTIESPCPNNTEWQTGVVFDSPTRIDYTKLLETAVHPHPLLPPALPMLQSLTLHCHGPDERKFDLGRAAAMFFHPTLRNITLSCTNFDADLSILTDVAQKIKPTPLQSLTLIECNVNVKFLDFVLGLPRALKELSLGERIHIFDECRPSEDPATRTTNPLFLDALSRQAHSLERLVHIGGSSFFILPIKVDPAGSAKLRSFSKLQRLELGPESVLMYYLMHDGCPDSLQKLRILDAAMGNRHMIDTCGATYKVCAGLVESISRKIEIDIVHTSTPYTELLKAYGNRRSLWLISAASKSRGIRFRVCIEVFENGKLYIPPYMHGEDTPVEKLFYDSDDFWRVGGVKVERSNNPISNGTHMNMVTLYLACKRCTRRKCRCSIRIDGSACGNCSVAQLKDCTYMDYCIPSSVGEAWE